MSRPCWQTLLSGRAAGSARLARAAALLLTGLILLADLGWGASASQPASGSSPGLRLVADNTPAKVTLQITTITPLSPGPKDTLRISGRVVSRSGSDLTQVQVSLHLGKSVASRTELQGLRANPIAQILATDPQRVGDGQLSPGHSLPFTITVPISKLALQGDGVYPMQVLATGLNAGAAVPVDLTTASTFLPYITSQETTPATPLAWLVSLTADPSLLADGSFTNDEVVSSVASGGRLRGLLDGLGAAKAVTATLDPAMIRALALAANARYVLAATPTRRPTLKPASTDAKNWLADLRAADQVSLIGLPYADADIDALLRAGQQATADEARQRGSDVLAAGLLKAKSRLTTDVAVPPGGNVDSAGAAYYEKQAKAAGLVLSASSVPAAGDNPSASASVPNVPARLLLSDDVLTRLVTAGPGADGRLAEQDIIAELAESHLEDRVTSGSANGTNPSTARPLLIAPAANWSPSTSWLKTLLTDTGRVSWLKQVTVSGLLSSPAEPRAALQYPNAARAAELPASLVDASARVSTATNGLFRPTRKGDAAQPQSPDSIVQPIRDAALSALSSRWRSNPSRSTTFLGSAQQTLTSLERQVEVVASPQVTLTSRSGKVPVTLENNLGAAVDVSLVLTSLDRSRVSSDTVVNRTVRAGQKVQVEVEVKAASAGTFPVRLALFTPDGQPLGTPAQVLVRSTKYGIVATIFTVVALSVLGLAVLFRSARSLVRRSRRTRREEPS